MKKENKQIVKAWLLILQTGISILVPTGIGIAAGILLKRNSGKDLILVFMILGLLGGLSSAGQLLYRFVGKDSEEVEKTMGIYDREKINENENLDDEKDYLMEKMDRMNHQREEILKKEGILVDEEICQKKESDILSKMGILPKK